MKRALCLVVSITIMVLFSSAFAGKRETKTVQAGDEFTVYTTPQNRMKNVVWEWDYNVLEAVGSIGTYSTSAKFRAKKASPSAGVVIQATTYYYVTNGSYTYLAKDFDSYTIHVKDNTTVSFAKSEYEIEYETPGQSSATYIEAIPSNSSYAGSYKWSASDYGCIYLNGDGKRANIHPRKVGQTTLTVKLDNGSSAQCRVRIVAQQPRSVDIDSYLPLVVGSGQYLKPTLYPTYAETTYSWTSDDSSIASVNSSGYVTGKSVGSTYIRVRTSNGKTDACQVIVSAKLPESVSLPESKSMSIGDGQTLDAIVRPVDASYSLTWESNDESVATVSAEGKVRAVSKGSADISVSTQNGKTASCRVVVEAPSPTSLTLSSNELSLYECQESRIEVIVLPENAEYSIEWTSSDENVATVSEGIILAKQSGNCVITATTDNGKTATCAVRVSRKVIRPTSITLPGTIEIEVGGTQTIKPEILPSNAETTLAWTSSDNEVATVENGLVSAMATGKCRITARTDNGFEASCEVTVIQENKPNEPVDNSSWVDTYSIKSTLVKYDDSAYDYPSEYSLTIDDVDGNLYVTSIIGLDCTKSFPYTGIPVRVESETSAIMELDVVNDAGSHTNDGEHIGGLLVLSSNPEYHYNKLGNIVLSKTDDGSIQISDFYVFFFGLDSDFDYRKDAFYSNNKSYTDISAGMTIVDCDTIHTNEIEIFNLDGIQVYKGPGYSDIRLKSGIYIVKRGNKKTKVLIRNN